MPVLLRTTLSRAARRGAAAALASLLVASTAGAQPSVAPAGVHTVVAPPSGFTAESRAAVRVADRGDRVFDHTVNGALIGAGAGLAWALVLRANAGNPREESPVFFMLPAAGGVLGAVVGTVVGLVRTR